MRNSLRGAGLVAAGLLVLTAIPSFAAPRAERELLGIRLWNRYSDVLARHGQPTRIENGLVTSSSTGSGGLATGGVMAGGGMMAGSGMSLGMKGGGGMAGGGMLPPPGIPGGGGSAAMGNPASMMSRMRGGMGRGGMDTGTEMGGGGPPAGFGLGSGAPGMGMAGGQATTESEARQTWVYTHGSVNDYFVFNKDGRVIQVESSTTVPGNGGGGITAQTVRLGDSVAKVYSKYGWTKVMRSGAGLVLDYTRDYHVAFQLADVPGKGPVVTGVAVTLLDVVPSEGTSGGAGLLGSAAMGGGMPGMPGMGGRTGLMSGGGELPPPPGLGGGGRMLKGGMVGGGK